MQRLYYFIMLLLCSFAIHSQDTILKLYRPFAAANQDNIVKAQSKYGYCFDQSRHTIRKDAWRCKADSKIYDPCFVKQSKDQNIVFCPFYPWNNKAVQIKLSKPVDNRRHKPLDMSQRDPWAVILNDGTRCESLGSKKRYENLLIRYHCQDNSFLFGHIQRCDPSWKIMQRKANQTRTVTISKAWF